MSIERADWSGGGTMPSPSAGTALVSAQSTGTEVDSEVLNDARRALSTGHADIDFVRRHYGLTDAEIAALQRPQRTSLTSVDKELQAIDKYRRRDRRAYNNNLEIQHRERELLELRQMLASDASRTAVAPVNDAEVIKHYYGPELVKEWAKNWGVDRHLENARENVAAAYEHLDETERAQLQHTFDNELPATVRTEIIRWMARDAAAWRPADQDYIDQVASMGPAFVELIKEWGNQAPAALGRARGRSKMMLEGMSRADRAAAEAFFDRLPDRLAVAVVRGLAGRRGR